MLTSGKVSLQDLPSVDIPAKSSEWPNLRNEQKQDIAKPPSNCTSALHAAAALGSPHLLCRSSLEDKVFLSCLEKDVSATVPRV